jgi:hypothetical protein
VGRGRPSPPSWSEAHLRTFQRRHLYVRDVVEAHELVVPLIKTDDNPADFFTKPVSSDKFFKFRAIIMNIKGELSESWELCTFPPPQNLPRELARTPCPFRGGPIPSDLGVR